LNEFISSYNGPIYGTFIEGKNIYNIELPKKALVVMGNEANGISPEIEKLITQKISIPAFGRHQETESLNVATATAIILSEFRRR
ncbi:MAG: RNA methyltransferase, partial [Flavobacteriaceae bacterium]|nr:RNA methyltransferase [Flavobacteriaceae bacterium]